MRAKQILLSFVFVSYSFSVLAGSVSQDFDTFIKGGEIDRTENSSSTDGKESVFQFDDKVFPATDPNRPRNSFYGKGEGQSSGTGNGQYTSGSDGQNGTDNGSDFGGRGYDPDGNAHVNILSPSYEKNGMSSNPDGTSGNGMGTDGKDGVISSTSGSLTDGSSGLGGTGVNGNGTGTNGTGVNGNGTNGTGTNGTGVDGNGVNGDGSSVNGENQQNVSLADDGGQLKDHYDSEEDLLRDVDDYFKRPDQKVPQQVMEYQPFEDPKFTPRKLAKQRLYVGVEEQRQSVQKAKQHWWNFFKGWLARLLRYLSMIIMTIDAVNEALDGVLALGEAVNSLKESATTLLTEIKRNIALGKARWQSFELEKPEDAIEEPEATSSELMQHVNTDSIDEITATLESDVLVSNTERPDEKQLFKAKKQKFLQDNMIDIGGKILYLKNQLTILKKSIEKVKRRAEKDSDKDKAFRLNYEAKELYNQMLVVMQEIAALRIQLGVMRNIRTMKPLQKPLLSE